MIKQLASDLKWQQRSASPVDVDIEMFGHIAWSAADIADLTADFSARPEGLVHLPQQPRQPAAAATRASLQRPNNRFSAPFRGAAQQEFGGRQPDSDDNFDFNGQKVAFEPSHAAPTAAPAGRSHAQKMEKQQQDWERAHDLLCARAVRHTPPACVPACNGAATAATSTQRVSVCFLAVQWVLHSEAATGAGWQACARGLAAVQCCVFQHATPGFHQRTSVALYVLQAGHQAAASGRWLLAKYCGIPVQVGQQFSFGIFASFQHLVA